MSLFKIKWLCYHTIFSLVIMQLFMMVFSNFEDAQSAQASGHLADIAKIESQMFDDAWDGLTVRSVLTQFGAGVLTAKMDDDAEEVAGYCIYQMVFEVAEVLRIATHGDYQKKGVAWGLLDELDRRCRAKGVTRILLEVRADNVSALRLYEKHGFYQIDVRTGYYKDEWGKMDALILQKDL